MDRINGMIDASLTKINDLLALIAVIMTLMFYNIRHKGMLCMSVFWALDKYLHEYILERHTLIPPSRNRKILREN